MQFCDPVHKVPIDGPVELCKTYGMNVLYHLECMRHQCISTNPNAFEILMAASREKLPHQKQGDHLNGYQKLHNAVLEVFDAYGIGWSPQSVDTIGEHYLSFLWKVWKITFII